MIFDGFFTRNFIENCWKWVLQAWGIILNKFQAELLILGPNLKIVIFVTFWIVPFAKGFFNGSWTAPSCRDLPRKMCACASSNCHKFTKVSNLLSFQTCRNSFFLKTSLCHFKPPRARFKGFLYFSNLWLSASRPVCLFSGNMATVGFGVPQMNCLLWGSRVFWPRGSIWLL